MTDVVQDSTETEHVQKVSISLTAYEWHILLDELHHSMSVVNRDTSNAENLWDIIANKLNYRG